MSYKKYFVCHRFRQLLTKEYIQHFIRTESFRLHNTYKKALEEMYNGFYDDSDYAVCEITMVTTAEDIKIIRRNI